MAFVDEDSATGFIMPVSMLIDEGVSLKDLSRQDFLGTHDDVMKAVVKGDFDAGAVMESAALRYKDRGIKILAVSRDMPAFNISASPAVSEELREAVKNAVMMLKDDNPEGLRVLRGIDRTLNGFAPVSDDEYEGVREVLEKVKRA